MILLCKRNKISGLLHSNTETPVLKLCNFSNLADRLRVADEALGTG